MDDISTKPVTAKLVPALILIGALALLFRGFLSSSESIPTGDSVWELTMSVNIDATENNPTVYMAVPQGSVKNRVISQTFTHSGFELKRLTQRKNVAGREIIAIARDKGKLSFIGEYKIHISQTKRWQAWIKETNTLNSDERAQFLEIPSELQLSDDILKDALEVLRSKAGNQGSLIEEIFRYTHHDILSDQTVLFESLDKILSHKRADTLGKATLMVALCRASNIPARIVTGVVVKEILDANEHYWVEVYSNNQWISYDPAAGYTGELPATYLKLKENNARLAYLKDGAPLDVIIDIEQVPTPAGLMGAGEKRLSDIFDLDRLPLATRFLLATLLLLPFGALITILFRNIIGVHTYGTFTPSLLALSMLYADWITVAIVTTLVTITGIGGRSLLPKKMSRAPRLSIVMTIVAITMVFSVSLMDYFNLNPNPSVVLLPIVVLVSLVDRIYAITDENGLAVAIHRLVWTCLVAAVCYMVFSIEMLHIQLVSYPEIHFFTLALILICNSYKGKMLADVANFSWLQEPKSNKPEENTPTGSKKKKKASTVTSTVETTNKQEIPP